MRRGLPALPVRRFVVPVVAMALAIPFAPAAAPPSMAGSRTADSPPAPTQWPGELSPDELKRIWETAPAETDESYGALPDSAVKLAGVAPDRVTTRAAAVVARVIVFARQQLGLPYQWGGNGPQSGDAGFDCSGLTQSSYAAGGLPLPRTAQDQYYANGHLDPSIGLQPGDLVFYGTPSVVHHVGLYVGRQVMIHSPTFGQNVQVSRYRWSGDDYLGATWPTSHLGGLGSYQPEMPSRLPGGYSAGAPASGTQAAPGGAPASASTPAPGAGASPGTTPAESAPGAAPAPATAPAPSESPPPPLTPLPLPLPIPLPTLSPSPLLPSLPPILP